MGEGCWAWEEKDREEGLAPTREEKEREEGSRGWGGEREGGGADVSGEDEEAKWLRR